MSGNYKGKLLKIVVARSNKFTHLVKKNSIFLNIFGKYVYECFLNVANYIQQFLDKHFVLFKSYIKNPFLLAFYHMVIEANIKRIK